MRSPIAKLCALLLALLLPAASAVGDGSCCPPAAAISASGGNAGALSRENAPSAIAVDGFFASAFSSEYGGEDRNILIRWASPLKLYIQGEPTGEDTDTLRGFLQELARQVPGLPVLSFVTTKEEANVIVSFVPYAQMAENLSAYEPDNWGFMNCFDDNGDIRYGLIAIASDVTSQLDRNHLIREEFVNMLGLTDDIGFAEDSIIYQPYTRTQSLAAMDYEMLNLLYSPFLLAGMTQEAVRDALAEIFPDS